MRANAPINYYDQASRQAQESIANRPDFSRAFSGVGSAGVSSGGASRDGGYRGGSSGDKPSDFGDARSSQNVPSDVRAALSIPAGDRTAKQNKRVTAWEGSTQGKEMGGAAGYAESQMTPQERADQQLERDTSSGTNRFLQVRKPQINSSEFKKQLMQIYREIGTRI